MSSNSKHNCRLCGNVLCDRCSGKFHIPLVFELKGKKGATRVCYGCRDSCIEQRNKEQQQERNPTVRGSIATLQSGVGNRGLEIAPPVEWADASKPTECKKCRKVTSKPRNCRLCGKCFDDKCTSKMNVPACFERKAKSGPGNNTISTSDTNAQLNLIHSASSDSLTSFRWMLLLFFSLPFFVSSSYSSSFSRSLSSSL